MQKVSLLCASQVKGWPLVDPLGIKLVILLHVTLLGSCERGCYSSAQLVVRVDVLKGADVLFLLECCEVSPP